MPYSVRVIQRALLEKFYPAFVLLVALILALMFLSHSEVAKAKNRLDLDDLEIKGELLNDDRLVILARERNELKNYVKFRTNFRPEMVQGLPTPAAKNAP